MRAHPHSRVHAIAPGVPVALSGGYPRMHSVLEGVRTRVRGRSLEQRLAAGEDPASDPLLTRRAAQLAGRRAREATASGIERALRYARDPARHVFSSAVPVCRSEVLIAEPALIALARRLRDGAPIWPVGVARARAMLTDSCSPLYLGGDPGAVRELAHAALDDLDDGPA